MDERGPLFGGVIPKTVSRIDLMRSFVKPLLLVSFALDGLFSWSVLLGTLYLSTIGGSTWIITLQLCKQKLLYFNLL